MNVALLSSIILFVVYPVLVLVLLALILEDTMGEYPGIPPREEKKEDKPKKGN